MEDRPALDRSFAGSRCEHDGGRPDELPDWPPPADAGARTQLSQPQLPQLGLWTQRLVQCAADFAEVKVVSPVPYTPPLPAVGPLEYFARFRRVPFRRFDGAVEVVHPRIAVGPGHSTYPLESLAYSLTAAPCGGSGATSSST